MTLPDIVSSLAKRKKSSLGDPNVSLKLTGRLPSHSLILMLLILMG